MNRPGMSLQETLDTLLQDPQTTLTLQITKEGHLQVRWGRWSEETGDWRLTQLRKINPLPELAFLTLLDMATELIQKGHIKTEETVEEISSMYRDHYRYTCGCLLLERVTDDEEVRRFLPECPLHEEPIDPVALQHMKEGMAKAGL